MALFNKPEPSRRVDNPARAVAAIIDPEPSVVLVDDRDAAYARVGSVATVAKRRFDLTAVHLSGPDGNAFAIMGLVRRLLKQMGEDPAPILEEMRSGDYDHLLEVAEDAVGDFVIFYR
jgi:hypothetical protein